MGQTSQGRFSQAKKQKSQGSKLKNDRLGGKTAEGQKSNYFLKWV